jgi:hypothetical protein
LFFDLVEEKKTQYKATNDVVTEIKKNDSIAKTPSSREKGLIEKKKKKSSQTMYTNVIKTKRIPTS